MRRAQLLEEATCLGLSVTQHQDPTTGKLVILRSFDIRRIKSEFRRLKAEDEGFVVNVSAIFAHTNIQLAAEKKI